MKKLLTSLSLLALFSQSTLPIAAQAGADLFNNTNTSESVESTVESETNSSESVETNESEETTETTESSESEESSSSEEEISSEESSESETSDSEDEETPTDDESDFIPADVVTLFEEHRQDNTKLDVAWEDYQQVADYTFYDLTVMDPTGVTTYDEILENFETISRF